LFVCLSLAAAGDDLIPGDVRLTRWIQETDGAAADAIAGFGNLIGTYWAGLALTIPLLVVFGWTRHWRPFILLLAILVIRALNSTVKSWVDSPRPTPDLIRVTEDAHGLGFPSGHAMGSALLFGTFALLAWTYLPPGRRRLASVLICLAIIAGVGFGRIHTGAHWPSDVLGGYVLGAALLLTLIAALSLDRPPAPDQRTIDGANPTIGAEATATHAD
jgi:undecaprenyl-diphosphatase